MSYTPTTKEVRACASLEYRSEASVITEAEFDLWLAGVKKQECERISLNIIDRVRDLMSCTKDDNCQEFGELIYSYIEEWIDEVADATDSD